MHIILIGIKECEQGVFFSLRKKLSNIKAGNIVTYVIFVCFIAGITFGCNGFVLEEEIIDEIVKSFENGVDFNLALTDAFIKNSIFIFFLYLCGMSMIGGICVLYLIFTQGVSIGSSVCAIVSVAETQKFLVLLELMPGYFFITTAYILMARSAFLYSLNINTKTIFSRKNIFKYDYRFIALTATFGISVLFCYISALCEVFFIPSLK